MSYPEHEKLEKVADQSQAIGEFLEWLLGKYILCTYESGDYPVPKNVNIRALLAEFFHIDPYQLEKEKQAMLEEVRNGKQS